MNLYEFRKNLESKATIENERLKQDLQDIQKKYEDMLQEYTEKVRLLNEDCRTLASRCYVFSQGGSMCIFCELHGYRCPHEVSFDDKINFAKELKKNAEN